MCAVSEEDTWARYMAAAMTGCGGRLSEENCAKVADSAMREHWKRYPKPKERWTEVDADRIRTAEPEQGSRARVR